MAATRRKAGQRREPLFDATPTPGLDLRPDPRDRPGGAPEERHVKRDPDKRRPAVARERRTTDDERAAPLRGRAEDERRAQNGKVKRGRSGGGSRRRSGLGRLLYWMVVLGLWAAIAAGWHDCLGGGPFAADPVAGSAETSARHPDPRSRRKDARDPRRNGRRRGSAQGAAEISSAGVPRHRGSPVLPAFRHRSHRRDARRIRQPHAPRRVARGLDAHAAARQEPVPDAGAHVRAQGAGGDARAVARAQARETADPRALRQPGLFRRRRLWGRSRGATLLRQIRAAGHARRSRDARRPGQVAVAACAHPQSARGRERAPSWCSPR